MDSERSVGAYEAKTHLPQLLEEVARGGRIRITKRGVPVAVLVPATEHGSRDVAGLIQELEQLSNDIRLDGLSVRDLIEEGRV